MSTVKCYLFGQFHLQCDDRIWYGPESAKACELLCYLLIHGLQPQRRERLASLLWEDYSTAQSKKCLRQALWQLQSACASFICASSDLILVTPEWVRLNPEVDLWKDISVFEQAYAAAPKNTELDAGCVQLLDNAVQLYRGDLFEGLYRDWCLFERERLQNVYIAMLDRLMSHCAAHEAYESALAYGAHLLRHDPASERTHQRMMRIQYITGDRTEALRQYERCVAALRDELGVIPAGATTALYERIRADDLDPIETTPDTNWYPPDAPSMPAFLNRLKQIYLTLTGLQKEVRQEIERVEQFLGGSDSAPTPSAMQTAPLGRLATTGRVPVPPENSS
ncbi:MAG TPA: bacterial transcriptional activator domain-containing protein [Blastocatellia bacterium]|jgi:DNA-binding SARP family transcriptional activator|nr:bacterial transcriptional activator domain-containing protein [Blastocatellia bacterium]